MVQRALQRLPYYGVFDFLSFRVNRGVVSVGGFTYRASLKSDASAAIKRVDGIDEIANKIAVLPASQNDDRIRWATALQRAFLYSVPRHAPFGTYPIHIIVKNGRTMLLGVVDTESDKTLAAVRARDVSRVIGVDNDLVVEKN
jgi:hyperosmotically inducible periplasmic protein